MVAIQEAHGVPGTASWYTIARNIGEGLAPLTVASAGLAFLLTELVRALMALASWLEDRVREQRKSFREAMRKEGRDEGRKEGREEGIEEARKEFSEWLRERGVDETPPWENGHRSG